MQSSYQSSTVMAACAAAALALHGILLFALGFEPELRKASAPTIEITLATFATESAPDNADYLAQENQQGSGTLEEKARPSSDLPSPFQDNQLNAVQLLEQAEAIPEQVKSSADLVTTMLSQLKVKSQQENQNEIIAPPERNPHHRIDFSSEIASLEADFNQLRQAYAMRPIVHRINTASTRKADVQYQEIWRRKVMRIGQINYPEEARQQKIFGQLRLAVQIQRDGTLKSVEIIHSSGQKVLDDAAIRIVRMAAPYMPFPPNLKGYDVIEIIRTWRFEPGNLFSG